MQANQNPAAETKRTMHYIQVCSAKVPLFLLWDFFRVAIGCSSFSGYLGFSNEMITLSRNAYIIFSYSMSYR